MNDERLTDADFSEPTREQLIRLASPLLNLAEGDQIESISVNGVEVAASTSEARPTLIDDREPSVSVRTINAGLPTLGK